MRTTIGFAFTALALRRMNKRLNLMTLVMIALAVVVDLAAVAMVMYLG